MGKQNSIPRARESQGDLNGFPMWGVGLWTILGEFCVSFAVPLLFVGAGILFFYGLQRGFFNIVLLAVAVGLGCLSWTTWRSLQGVWTPPRGIALQLEEMRRLTLWIDLLQHGTGSRLRPTCKAAGSGKPQSPLIHQVLLTDDFNANIIQLPRWGGIGGYRNYLLMGLPMLYALSPEQCRAILAHELGHLSHQHGRFAGWVYRRYHHKALLLSRLQSGRSTFIKDLAMRCLRWYVPSLEKAFFAIAQADEFRADRYAAHCTDGETVAEALVQLHVKAHYLTEQFWPTVFAQAAHHPDPPKQLFLSLGDMLQNPRDLQAAAQGLQTILAQSTSPTETHPCLSDRLTALGISPHQVPLNSPFPATAAQVLLGTRLSAYATTLSQEWYTKIRFQWRARHTQFQRLSHQSAVDTQTQTCSTLDAANEVNAA
jgi:Zn-dependent protease with chaperone function